MTSIMSGASDCIQKGSIIAGFMGPTWGPPGADRTQVAPFFLSMNLVIWTAICGNTKCRWLNCPNECPLDISQFSFAGTKLSQTFIKCMNCMCLDHLQLMRTRWTMRILMVVGVALESNHAQHVWGLCEETLVVTWHFQLNQTSQCFKKNKMESGSTESEISCNDHLISIQF